MVEGYLMTT